MGSFTLRDMNLAKKLDKLESWLRDIKSNQFTGQDVVTIHESTRAGTHDFTLTAAAGYVYKYVVFVADKQANTTGVIRWQVGSGSISNTASPSQFTFAGQDMTFYEPSGNENRIVIGMNVYNDGSTTLYYKAYAEATDTGKVYILNDYTPGDPLP